jgi:hypothetical protein
VLSGLASLHFKDAVYQPSSPRPPLWLRVFRIAEMQQKRRLLQAVAGSGILLHGAWLNHHRRHPLSAARAQNILLEQIDRGGK